MIWQPAVRNVQMEGKIRVQNYERSRESEETQLTGVIRTDVKDYGCGIMEKGKLVAPMGGRLGIVPLGQGGTLATIRLQRVGGENHGQEIHQ